jgi:hypothetical protein
MTLVNIRPGSWKPHVDAGAPHKSAAAYAACVCGATDGALESWDLSAIAGPRGTDAEVGTWSYHGTRRR